MKMKMIDLTERTDAPADLRQALMVGRLLSHKLPAVIRAAWASLCAKAGPADTTEHLKGLFREWVESEVASTLTDDAFDQPEKGARLAAAGRVAINALIDELPELQREGGSE